LTATLPRQTRNKDKKEKRPNRTASTLACPAHRQPLRKPKSLPFANAPKPTHHPKARFLSCCKIFLEKLAFQKYLAVIFAAVSLVCYIVVTNAHYFAGNNPKIPHSVNRVGTNAERLPLSLFK
jgi:hypothetical protein